MCKQRPPTPSRGLLPRPQEWLKRSRLRRGVLSAACRCPASPRLSDESQVRPLIPELSCMPSKHAVRIACCTCR